MTFYSLRRLEKNKIALIRNGFLCASLRQNIFIPGEWRNVINYWFNAKIIKRKNSFRQNTLDKSTYFLSIFSLRHYVPFKLTSSRLKKLSAHLQSFEMWLKRHWFLKWQQFGYLWYDFFSFAFDRKIKCTFKNCYIFSIRKTRSKLLHISLYTEKMPETV